MNDGGESERGPGRKPPSCSICGKPWSERYRPFCSKRCADIDLARWLSGTYVIPGGTQDADEDGDIRPETAAGQGAAREKPDADE